MGFLDREALLKKESLVVETVDLGDGDHVYVRQMTGHERDRFEQSLFKETEGPRGVSGYEFSFDDFRAKLVVHTVCDADGVLLMEPGDAPTLSRHMSARRLEQIVNVAQRLNAITEEDRSKMVKNSGGGPSDGSISD